MSERCEGARSGGWRLDAPGVWTWEVRDEWADESTPIFRAVVSDWERKQRDVADERNALEPVRPSHRRATPPESRSGPWPDPRRHAAGRSRTAASMNTMPLSLPRASTSEDGIERRAKHREAQVIMLTAGGRHALQLHEEDTGRHACKVVRLVPRT